MSESAKAYSRTWRPAPQLPQRSGKFTRRLRLVLVAAALLVVSGTLIALLFAIRPFHRAYFLPLSIGEYGEEVPVRGWVRQDSEALRSLDWKERNAFTSQERELVLDELSKTAKSSFNGPLVIYLSAYALTNPKGELCILPVDAHLQRPDSWLPLRDVFHFLHDSKARHKLLLLDIMQPFTDARRGLLLNDAAECVRPLLDQAVAEDPRLSVLCACAPGQDSIVAEELGHSVFAYFLYEGLRGQADGENAGRQRDGRVSLLELARFVATQVEKWTLRHRSVRQSPQLHGSKDDYPLVSIDSHAAPPAEAPDQADYPEWLSAGWKQRDTWLDEESERLLPRTVRELEASLLRAEQWWRGGFPEEQVSQDLAAQRERLERQRRRRLPVALRRAAELGSDTSKFSQANPSEIEVYKQAQQCWNEMRVQLSSYVPYLEEDAGAEPAWANAVGTACEIRRLLAAPLGADRATQIRQLMALTATLRNDPNNLHKLRRPLSRQPFEQLISRRYGGDAADLRIMTALLSTPWPRADQRSRLWSARWELRGELQQKRTDSNINAWNEARALAAQHQRAILRAKRSLKLLRLEGADQLEKVEKAIAQAAEMPADKAHLRHLSEELNEAWTRQIKFAAGLEGR